MGWDLAFVLTKISTGLCRGSFCPWSLCPVPLLPPADEEDVLPAVTTAAVTVISLCCPETLLWAEPLVKPTHPFLCPFTIDKRSTIQNQEVNVALQ